MIILLYILFVLAIISNIVSALFYMKSANRKAHYTMIEIKALRQVRDQIEKLSKWKMKGTKRKQKVFEDNTSVPKYHFEGGVIKAQTTNKIIEES